MTIANFNIEKTNNKTNKNEITVADKAKLINDIKRHILRDNAAYERYIKIAEELNEAEEVAKELHNEEKTNNKLTKDREKEKEKLEKAKDKYLKHMVKIDEREAQKKQNTELKTVTDEGEA